MNKFLIFILSAVLSVSCVAEYRGPYNGSRRTDSYLCHFTEDVLSLASSNVVEIMNDVLLVQAIIDNDDVERKIESANVEVSRSYTDGSYCINGNVSVYPSERSIYETGCEWKVVMYPDRQFSTEYKIIRTGTADDAWKIILEPQPALNVNDVDLSFLQTATDMTMLRRDYFLNDWRMEFSGGYDEKNGFTAGISTERALEFIQRAKHNSRSKVSDCYYIKGEALLVTYRNGSQLDWCRTVWDGEGAFCTKMFTNISDDYRIWQNF